MTTSSPITGRANDADVSKDETLALIIVDNHSGEVTETDVSDLDR